MSKNSTGSN